MFCEVIANGLTGGKAGVAGTAGRIFQDGVELRIAATARSSGVHGNAQTPTIVRRFENFGGFTILADADFAAAVGKGVGIPILPLFEDDFDQFAAEISR